jgi:VCBS repeat-containing protein
MWTSGPSLQEVTYTPQTGFVGTDTFGYTESDGTGSATGQVTVTVNPSPPVATADTAVTTENTAVSINVLANDSSPSGGKLTLTGVTQGAHGTVAITSVTNSAVSISSGQEINAGSVLAYDRGQPFTVMAQLDVAQNPNAFGGTADDAAVIFTNVNASPYPGYELWIDATGHLRVRIISNITTGNYIDVQSSIVVTDGNWHDVAYSYDGSSTASGVKIYVDGHQDTATTTLVNSLTASIVSPTHGPLIIGNQANHPYALDGSLEQFSISDVVRSAAYIAQYSSPSSVAPVDANTELDYYFNQNTGTIVDDLSSNGYNATLSTAAMWTSGPSLQEVTYTPQTGFVGTDTFGYTESNGTGTGTGQVTVTVNPTLNPTPPVATADTAVTAENTAVSINVLANDSSPSGGKLTLTGVTQGTHGTVAITSVTNSAVNISSGQEINAGSVLAYDRGQPFTVMAQLDVAQKPTQVAVIASNLVGSGSAHPGYQMFIDPTGHLQVRLVSNYSTGNDIDVQSSFVVTDGNWHDVAVSYDGSGSASGIKIYEDGKQDTATKVIANSLTGSIVSSTPAPLIIGNQAGYESSYDLHGSLEQFSISNVVRSAAYIAQYSSPGSVAPVDAHMALDYHFNQNTGTIVDDLSSNGYNATLSTAAMWTSGPSLQEVTYTPQTGFVGTDTFGYTESDGTGSATGQVTVNVGSGVASSMVTANATPTGSVDPNPIVTTFSGLQIDATAPSAMPDRAHVALGASVEVDHAQASTSGALTNDRNSAPHDTLSVSAVQGQAGNVGHAAEGIYGSLTLNADGSYIYANTNPAAVTAAGGVAQDVFTYTASNGRGGSTTSTLTFVVTSPGDTYVGGATGATSRGGTGSYVDGGAGHDTVIAGSGNQTLVAGPGDTLIGGKGADTFVFAANFGNQTINNFNPQQDVIALPHAEIASFAAILADTHVEGLNAVIALGANDMITLNHVSPQSLHASDFHLL